MNAAMIPPEPLAAATASPAKEANVRIAFDHGTLIISGALPDWLLQWDGLAYDPRLELYRCEGMRYRDLILLFKEKGAVLLDEARQYQSLTLSMRQERKPFPHQSESVEAWWQGGGRGLVVLPTGTGKTFVAMLAAAKCQRSTLVVTPTIDLMHQWRRELELCFGTAIGQMGGGCQEIEPITVSTYQSAHLQLEKWGGRFGLLVFDEAHHLPGPTFSSSARGSIAPFRLGLTATPEKSETGLEAYQPLIGPLVYRREIPELAGDFLAAYSTERIFVELSKEDKETYQAERRTYIDFCQENQIAMGQPGSWQRFIALCSRAPGGWKAFGAFRKQKRLAESHDGKIRVLGQLLERHAGDRSIVFTSDNRTVYQIAREFLIPPLTHQTGPRERKILLEGFASGRFPTLVTSRVLNEGVDVPQAAVGIVMSGTSTVREHVQRLGRILRKSGAKHAILYELVTRGTSEEYASQRRRNHDAYR